MGDKTKIEWTDATWNPLRARNVDTGRVGHYCTKISAGCAHCYAEQWNLTGRGGMGTKLPYNDASRGKLKLCTDEKTLLQPLRWRRPRKVFVCSMTDLFFERHDGEELAKIFAVMALADQHIFQVLTKRIHVARDWFAYDGFVDAVHAAMEEIAAKAKIGDWCFDAWPLPNVVLGVSVENQAELERRLPILAETPAEWKFVSAEPLLGPLDFGGWLNLELIDQVIVGGESGPQARPMHPQWVRSIRDQCVSSGTRFFFKQWGEWLPSDQGTWRALGRRSRYERDVFEDGQHVFRVGKRNGGRLLDGFEWSEEPDYHG